MIKKQNNQAKRIELGKFESLSSHENELNYFARIREKNDYLASLTSCYLAKLFKMDNVHITDAPKSKQKQPNCCSLRILSFLLGGQPVTKWFQVIEKT